MPTIGPMELIVILVILLLLFGAKKLPELARSIGTSAKELKGAMRDEPESGKKNNDN
ncbi:MAG: twin-arginine translocase TatA/TatE family subunit [Candidatus Saccharimonas sp.]|nr:twin-arginine translocase TatA/TatE family subunit [Candidatus Saccharimonas sp.]